MGKEPAHRCLTTDGYVRLFRPEHPMSGRDGWVLEHRMVAYDQGWLFGKGDRRHVHHRNHDRQDNRLVNLEVMTPENHATHHHPQTIDWSAAPAMYEAGQTTTQIAEQLGTHAGNVSRRLREAGVVMRPSSGEWRRTPLDEDEIRRLHALGYRPARIAAHLGVGTEAVRLAMRRFGLPPFRPGRPESDKVHNNPKLATEMGLLRRAKGVG